MRARRVFDAMGDTVRESQVNDTLARLYIDIGQHDRAKEAIHKAVAALELTDSEALLVEALTTKGKVASRMGDYGNAKRSFEAAQKVAERCGDRQGACRALLGMFEELIDYLDEEELKTIGSELRRLMPTTLQPSLITRIEDHLAKVTLLLD